MLGYLGPEGSFSHQAAMEWSQGREELQQYSSMPAMIKAVAANKLDRAIIPIENSIEGGVNAVTDTLALEENVYITDEYILRICENLMVKKGMTEKDIKIITSHTQPIGQCSKLLNEEFPDVKIEAAPSTSAAAIRVSESDGSIACIGGKASAEIYGLDILRADCADDKSNATRFVIVENEPSKIVTECDKTSVAFSLDNRPGALYDALKLFAESGINMVKIESRPMKDGLGRYIFLVDIEGNIDDAKIYFALDKVKQNTEYYKFLGSYKMFKN